MTPITPRTTLLAMLLALAVAIPAVGEEPPVPEKSPADTPASQAPAKPRVLVTISKETTYITEPLRADGYPDYVAALNERMSKGVTPDNNAAVLFWKALGPGEIDPKHRDEYFKMLGMPSLPADGAYFVTLDKYLDRQKHSQDPAVAEVEKENRLIRDPLQSAMKRPWSKREFPALAGWLKANEEPLALLIEASQRPRRYDPLLSDNENMLIACLLPAVQQSRVVARVLIARAMLRADEGKTDESWDDLLSCHRLARLVGQGPMLIDALVAITIDGMADEGDQCLLSCANLKAAQIAKMREDLDRLPPMPKMVDKIDVSERFVYLDAVSCVARQGFGSLSAIMGDGKNYGTAKSLIDMIGSGADWNVALRMGNAWYDRIVDAYGKPPRTERKAALDKFDEDLRKMEKEAGDWKTLALSVLGSGRQAISERIGQIFVGLFMPALTTCATAEDRTTMRFELTKLGFALAAYRADNGSYPDKLADLTPKYVAKVPTDLFSDSDLHYKQEGDGYLLYSVGINGKDDGGKTYGDADESGEIWDDLVVRVPTAETPKAK
jgi:hypothetical protein